MGSGWMLPPDGSEQSCEDGPGGQLRAPCPCRAVGRQRLAEVWVSVWHRVVGAFGRDHSLALLEAGEYVLSLFIHSLIYY